MMRYQYLQIDTTETISKQLNAMFSEVKVFEERVALDWE